MRSKSRSDKKVGIVIVYTYANYNFDCLRKRVTKTFKHGLESSVHVNGDRMQVCTDY